MNDYDVVLLIEQPFTPTDAGNLRALHESIEDPVRYHVLMPVEDARARVQTAMGSLSAGEVLPTATSPTPVPPAQVEELQEALQSTSGEGLAATVAVIEQAGGRAVGETVSADPIQALADKVKAVDGREVIIMTRPHVVSEFFHLDWTSKARRRLGVPVLHLLEHENLDEQSAGEGEGISGF